MLQLVLARHAKSAWDDPSLTDVDRPLSPRGVRAAIWMGETFRSWDLRPGLIVCSPARRTRQTLEFSGIESGTVDYDRRVYDRRDHDYVELIREVGAGDCLMLVGHNVAMAATAAVLAPGEVAEFPTGAIAVFEFAMPDWTSIETGAGRLLRFARPPKG